MAEWIQAARPVDALSAVCSTLTKLDMQRVNIAIASPSDVQKERDAVLRVFAQWNETNDLAFLHPRMWELSAVPTLGDHPQHILNREIIETSDLLIAIFWSKLGTPTPTASSGTVEEIREFIRLKGPRRVMLFFCTRNLPHDINATELAKLQEFKAQMRTEGIYGEYETVEEFEHDLYRHLDKKVDEFGRGKLPLPPPPETADTTKEAKELPADSRLHNPIDFGNTLNEVAQGFAARMDVFDAIDGVHPDKFYALAAHVYSSVATCIDRFLSLSSAGMSQQNRDATERISSHLKHLALQIPSPKEPFPKYWTEGREISNHLTAHVAHIEKWKK